MSCGLPPLVFDVHPREALAGELVGDDLAGGVERGARLVDRGRALRVPAGALVAHVLQPHWLADRLGQHGGVHGAVVGVVAAIGAGARLADDAHLIERHAERGREALLHEVGLLRAAPAGDIAVLDLDQRAGRTHAGMRLERPFVFGLDHLGGAT